MPGEQSDSDGEEMLRAVHIVSEYTGLDMMQALDLPCDFFLLCAKNWMVDQLMQTEEGRDRLDRLRRLRETKLDRSGLHKVMAQMSGQM